MEADSTVDQELRERIYFQSLPDVSEKGCQEKGSPGRGIRDISNIKPIISAVAYRKY